MNPLVEIARARIAAGKPVRRTLPGGGRLHVERALPFLCVYRRPADRPDPGTAELIRAQASYLIAAQPDAELEDAVVGALVDACGACLVLSVWAGSDDTPAFRLHTRLEDHGTTTVDALANALRAMPSMPLPVEIVSAGEAPARPGVLAIGLEVPTMYRSPTAVYPAVLRAVVHDLTHALQRGFFEFARVQKATPPSHYHMMGRRRIVHAVREADRALAELSASFDFLLAVSPVNVEDAWLEFCDGRRRETPPLRYRMLELDPEAGKRRLYELRLDRLEDPVLAELLRDKRRELDRQLGLLEDRDTPRFLHGSLQLYPAVDDALYAEAVAILDAPHSRPPAGERVDAQAFEARARAELARYGVPTTVRIRDDLASLLVSHGDLFVPRRLDVAAARVDALLQHEIGTHVVTYVNGRAQPLQVMSAGLAGYEALQEGLAMLAEFIAGGLDGDRLRVIAARTVAVRRLVEGVGLPSLVAELTDRFCLSARAAFGVAVRVFRGGGLTKDAIYLRGLVQVLDHLRRGGELAPLLVGKLGFEQVPLVEELLRREVLRPAAITPRWLTAPGAADRLRRARAGLRPLDLRSAT